MNRIPLAGKALLGLSLAIGAAGVGGCVVRERGDVEVDTAPPAEQVEVVGVAPGPDFVWIGGFWEWGGHDYHWRGGRWDHRPQGHTAWVRDRWARGDHGWRHERGHWE